ncbi:MAG: PEP-CTERM sorting domain-containing protein, partial [Pseudomonadota bacterium]
MADLSGLSFSLAGVTVSDLHFSTDGLGGSSFSGSTWRDPEDTTSHLFLTADFTATAVPEPATLGLFGASLIGLGVVRRRRARVLTGAALSQNSTSSSSRSSGSVSAAAVHSIMAGSARMRAA